MPFKSKEQRRYLWANHPDVARRWTLEEKADKQLKKKVPKKSKT